MYGRFNGNLDWKFNRKINKNFAGKRGNMKPRQWQEEKGYGEIVMERKDVRKESYSFFIYPC